VLSQCEVALFVLKADSRDMRDVQEILRDVVIKVNPQLTKRIVVGLNQVDLVYPGDWIESGNIPSEAQARNIQIIMRERTKSLKKIYPIRPSHIVPYSALKRYHLQQLFYAMIASTSGEPWILNAKKSIADWRELVDPGLLVKREDRK
jgi:predicted GTPase